MSDQRAWRLRLLDRGRRQPWLLLGLVAVLGSQYAVCHEGVQDCQSAARSGIDGVTVAICQQEYGRTREPGTGARLADALRRTGDLSTARAIAHSLLATPAQADALFVLGKIAAQEKHYDTAQNALQHSQVLHRQERRWRESARDLLALSEVATARQDFAQALELLDQCVIEARRAPDEAMERYCHLTAARVLSLIGYARGALQELERVAALPADRLLRTQLAIERGNLHQELGDDAQAVVAFDQALTLAEQGAQTPKALIAHLNLTYSLLRTRRWEEAAEHLEQAAVLDVDDANLGDRLALQAELEVHRGNLPLAATLAERATAATGASAHDDLVEIETLRASIALQAGSFAQAEHWARQALAHVEAIRAQQPLLQLRSWAMARRRQPFEVLFSSLARRGLAEAALAAFDQWQAALFFDGLATAKATPSPATDLHRIAVYSEELQRLLAPLQARQAVLRAEPHLRPAPGDASALLALVVAGDEIWRIVVDRGAPTISDLGRFSELSDQLDELRTHPGEVRVASALGERLLSRELTRSTEDILRIALDEPFALMPISMLRVDGRSLIASRPLVRTMRPLDRSCAPRPDPERRAVVLADVTGDLPGARREAERIAHHLPAELSLGSQATRQALLATTATDLLHVAVHTEVDDLGGSLVLQDGRVSALELASRDHGPAQVVLATCDSAVAHGGTYSLAMAFLASGAHQVIATLRPISDEGAAHIAEQLYQAGPTDLVRALWHLQAKADSTVAEGSANPQSKGEDLSQFVVFGEVPCDAR